MATPHFIALDQGTTSSRALRFAYDTQSQQVQLLAQQQQEFNQSFPQSGWVEHDPLEIWSSQLACLCQVLSSHQAEKVAAIGITNQRETLVVWDRATSQPIYPAIVWQDRRTSPWCQQQRELGLEDLVRAKTGLVLDPYFSASKLVWILAHVPNARAAANRGDLACGTIDSWLLWMLTGGKVHATDVTNASRTMLFNIHTGEWDQDLLKQWQIPASLLPQVQYSAAHYGTTATSVVGQEIPICGVVGDQQSALFGQHCLAPGDVKNTYGTGCFMLLHTGPQARYSKHHLLTTRAAQWDAQPQFALEGSVFMGGAVVQWLRDGLGIIKASGDIEKLANAVSDSGGVVLVPAFAGLGAPYWDAEARGAVYGLTRGTTNAHLARAALDAIALQCVDLMQAMQADLAEGETISALRVDGGATHNHLLMQLQADLLQLPVLRPTISETTALGAASLAAVGSGWRAAATPWQLTMETVTPRQDPQRQQEMATLRARWSRAIAATQAFSQTATG
ncbi:glycerol kinase GlpK [Parvibium lacunae]|uniref:glycerol kinase n=1 Tax=Parvibium lacunae TaxID=1888893 RepID=A0A368L4H2_9BURK|nr:glycerol kinase GlpK [Parvibium lacunae]RCS58467.1 glycerol kinase [Parvibium lacunae]